MSDTEAVVYAPLANTTILAYPLADVVRTEVAARAFGMTRKAIERKIERGDWIEGRQYHRAPDGSIFIDVRGVTKWVTGG